MQDEKQSASSRKHRIAILTQDVANRSCELLKAQLEARGASVDLIQYDNPQATDPSLSYKSKVIHGHGRLRRGDQSLNIKAYDGVMLRSWGTERQGHAALKFFHDAGVTMANDHQDITAADSKVITEMRFSEVGIPIPPTRIVASGDDVEAALAGREYPLVIKRDIGSRGEGIYFPHSHEEALAQLKSMFEAGEEKVVLQDFIRCGDVQQTYRLFVVGDEVIGAMQLTAPEGVFVTNTAQGGTTELVDPPAEIKALAVRATKAMGLSISGVDIITDEAGKAYVLEANDSPKVSTLVDEHGIAADAAVADNFMAKIRARQATKSASLV